MRGKLRNLVFAVVLLLAMVAAGFAIGVSLADPGPSDLGPSVDVTSTPGPRPGPSPQRTRPSPSGAPSSPMLEPTQGPVEQAPPVDSDNDSDDSGEDDDKTGGDHRGEG